jgi:hypothetical protein
MLVRLWVLVAIYICFWVYLRWWQRRRCQGTPMREEMRVGRRTANEIRGQRLCLPFKRWMLSSWAFFTCFPWTLQLGMCAPTHFEEGGVSWVRSGWHGWIDCKCECVCRDLDASVRGRSQTLGKTPVLSTWQLLKKIRLQSFNFDWPIASELAATKQPKDRRPVARRKAVK